MARKTTPWGETICPKCGGIGPHSCICDIAQEGATVGTYTMTPKLRVTLHEAIDAEDWDDAYKGECHEAVDLWKDGPVVSKQDGLSTEEMYAMFADEDAPDPHLIGMIEYFGVAHLARTETDTGE